MPTYEYLCAKHGVFDHAQRITEPALKDCPLCHECIPKRLISGAPEFHLVSGPSGHWANAGYGHKPHELAAMKKLGRKLVKRTY